LFKKKGFPKRDELVICTVKRINPHSAFVDLDDYDNVKGMIHISEVALRGVKNIKNHLSIGKKVVCKMLYIKDNVVDVSLKRVNSGARKQKLNDVRSESRFYHLVEHACKEAGKPKLTDKVVLLFVDKYGSILNAYEALRDKGLKFLDGISLPDKVGPVIRSNFQSLLKQLVVKIRRTMSLTSSEGDGVVCIKRLLADTPTPKNVSLSLSYKGSGDFTIVIEAMNYKIAEDFFDKLSDELIAKGRSDGVMVSFGD